MKYILIGIMNPVNRYSAIKRLNKSNFINLLSMCDEETVRSIMTIEKKDMLKLISDKLTKQDLQQIIYNMEIINTQDIIDQHEIRLNRIRANNEITDMSSNKIERVRIPEFQDDTVKKKMNAYIAAYRKYKSNEKKQNDVISVIRDNSKREISIFFSNISNFIKNRKLPIFEEMHEMLFKTLTEEQQGALRIAITELEVSI